MGIDSDQVDVFLGPMARGHMTPARVAALRNSTVYLVHTRKPPDFIELDEQKCFLGFETAAAVQIAFREHYDHPGFFGQMDALPWPEFKAHVRATAEGNPMIRGEVVARAPLTLVKAVGPATPRRPGFAPAPLTMRGRATAGTKPGPAQPIAAAPTPADAKPGEEAATSPAPPAPEALAEHLVACRPILAKARELAEQAFPGADVAARLRETTALHGAAAAEGGTQSADDVGSVRITVASLAEEQQAVDRVRRLFKVQSEDDFLTKARAGGYRAYHFVVTVDGMPIELQLRTERQTRWADYAHDAAYTAHGQQPPPELGAYLSAMGAYLATLDGETRPARPDTQNPGTQTPGSKNPGAAAPQGSTETSTQAPQCPPAVAEQYGELEAT
jgi:hypothetical protein